VTRENETTGASYLADPTRLWISTDHATHYPVGGASIVMANSEPEARDLMAAALRAKGLDPAKGFTLLELNISIPFARVLCDGEY
jgi:hypothetical protein